MIELKDAIAAAGAALGTVATFVGGVVWKKADNAVPKEDFKQFMKDMRDTTRELYANAESDRKQLHECVDRLDDKIHKLHIKVIEGMRK